MAQKYTTIEGGDDLAESNHHWLITICIDVAEEEKDERAEWLEDVLNFETYFSNHWTCKVSDGLSLKEALQMRKEAQMADLSSLEVVQWSDLASLEEMESKLDDMGDTFRGTKGSPTFEEVLYLIC